MILFSCSKSSETTEIEMIENPTAVSLIFPYENSLCNQGTNITEFESTVLFEWEESENTDNYVLSLKNLLSGNTTTHETTNTEITIVIERGTPYEWHVVSESYSTSETAQSPKWRFYNADDGIQTYAPFPAEIVYPMMAEIINTTENEIYLEWIGSDVDNDIVGYDIYFDTAEQPSIFVNDHSSNILNNVSFTLKSYYQELKADYH